MTTMTTTNTMLTYLYNLFTGRCQKCGKKRDIYSVDLTTMTERDAHVCTPKPHKSKGSIPQIIALVAALGSFTGLSSFAALKSIEVAENDGKQDIRIENLASAAGAASAVAATLERDVTDLKVEIAIIKEYSRLMAERQYPVLDSDALEERVKREVASSTEQAKVDYQLTTYNVQAQP